jgi:hypothetical protein
VGVEDVARATNTDRPTPEQRQAIERVIRDLKEVQVTMTPDSDAEGYVGEAISALGLALGRHDP